MSTQFFHGKGSARQYRSQKDPAERTADGILFGSVDEMRAYIALKGVVAPQWLTLQPVFSLLPKHYLQVNGKRTCMRPCTWKADFLIGPPRASDNEGVDARHLVIDIKGMPTDVFKLKLKLFNWCYKCMPFVAKYSTKKARALFLDTVVAHCKTYGYGLGS